ncbi:hypothetical protein MO973_01500 [Paenibacillus sp. TRM 82003]|uniref:hypothetical protein n=1 Tax=Kineococcus sp. TRM81007 TaxID=2925831 RepID=UPI001F57D8C4|nr:hypothetical protein [Kineococcus sp. TRM81007]MCI2240525.1 hypothetical protein [Kineococcus sp. TRM81007]MCI3918904.1 hypothetical protein [Paenibacillus sp. TRM 82003]
MLRRELPPTSASTDHVGWDTTLDRWVRVRTIDAADPRAAEFLDAGRRAATLSDPRLPRVLDAGTDLHETASGERRAVAFVVEEAVQGWSMGDLLREGTLTPAAVRGLVGEAATALDAAARRGLHHTRLTPESVVLGPDAVVRVLGTGVEAALQEDPPAVSPARAAALANRADAVGLVALTYAGLSGRWPRVDDLPGAPGLPEAPTAGGRWDPPVPLKELRPDAPNDLDTLCSVTFGPHEDGPREPAELALQLAPWSLDDLGDALHRMRGELATAEVRGRLSNRDEVVPEEEPPVPFTRPRSTGRPQQEDSRFVLALVGGVVLLGLVLAMWQLRGLSPDDEPSTPPAATSPTATATTSAPPPAPAPPPPPAPAPLPVASVTAVDPLGDGEEGTAPERVTDGDPATAWDSERYDTPDFGGLKDGVGVLLDLGAEVDVTSVQLTASGEGGTVELRTATGGEDPLAGSTVVAQAPAGGEQTLAPAEPVRTRWLLLWFTQAPTTDGENRVSLGEVQVQGTPAAP